MPDTYEIDRVCIRLANLARLEDQQAILEMTDQYARHPMGGGKPLRPDVRERLIEGLQAHPSTLIFLACLDQRAVGIATCFVGFSTFEARSLLNIHDLAVIGSYQGHGVGQRLIEAAIGHARDHGYCAITLEVRLDNAPARRLYDRMGFRQVGETVGAEAMLFGKLRLEPFRSK